MLLLFLAPARASKAGTGIRPAIRQFSRVLTEGNLLGSRYRIQQPLGQGGMGVVFLAIDESTGQSVAVKGTDLLGWGPSQRAGILDQFRREAQTLLRLDHPNLPKFLAFLEEGDQAYLVMEYIPGRNLAQITDQEGCLSEQQAMGYMRRLARVLEYLHGQTPSVIFRDLKPSNVMLTPDGELKLIDFGLAKCLEAGEGSMTQSSARGLVSPGFSAPEQYAGGTDERSDLYALGATAYYLLTGKIPPESVHLATSGQGVPAVDALNPEISASTTRLVRKLMQLRRDQRPASAREVVAELERYSTLEVGTQQVVFRPRPRRRLGRLAAAVGGATVLAAGVWWQWPRGPAFLHLESSPPGAQVYLDGAPSGLTPCNLTVKSGRGRLRLEKDGYFPASDRLYLDPGASPSLRITMRTGSLPPGSQLGEESLPGYYPPGRGVPPGSNLWGKTHQVAGFPFSIPPQWRLVGQSESQVAIQSADGLQKATLWVEPAGSVSEGLQEKVEALRREGWSEVRVLQDQRSGLAYVERQQATLQARGAVVVALTAVGGERRRVGFFLEYSPCPDAFAFIKELDFMRGHTGLRF